MWHHWRVFRVELQGRRWPRLVKNVWLVFAFFGGSMLVLHYALKYFFPSALVGAWIISVLLAMVGLLLLMLRFWHSYHDRILVELRDEWDRRVPIIETIGSYLFAGQKLKQAKDNPAQPFDSKFVERVDEWHRHAASQLFQHLGEDCKDKFYKGSKSLDEAPSESEFPLWIHNRLHVLGLVIKEQKARPEQLVVETCARVAEENNDH